MVLNVTPDHLDRYRDLEDYATTKARIFAGLGAGSLALLGDCGVFDALVAEAIPRGASRVDVGAGHPVHVAPETLVVDPRVARFLSHELFHLSGYRKAQRAGGKLVYVRRRPSGRAVPL